jgi:hypothetical protein
MPAVTTDVHRSPPWLPLLRRLTEASSIWGVWKNADAALAGFGDVDSAAPESDWPMIQVEFGRWAKDCGFGPTVACQHVEGVLFILALLPDEPTFLELDVNAKKYFRGWTMFTAEDLVPAMEIDERGFRRVRRGVEGVIHLVQNGLRWGGRPNIEKLDRKRVREALRADPDGVRVAARLFGPAEASLLRAARAVSVGGWDQSAMLALEARCTARAFLQPGVLWGRARSRSIKRDCPLLRAIFTDHRRLPADRTTWLSRVEETHPAVGIGA